MKNLVLSYLLCALGLVTPVAGIHRFYLNKPFSGVFYLMTWGFFGIGTVLDLVRMKDIVEPPQLALNMDAKILRYAKRAGGVLTVPMLVIETGLTVERARKELRRLQETQLCTMDIDMGGNEIYHFQGLTPREPLLARD